MKKRSIIIITAVIAVVIPTVIACILWLFIPQSGTFSVEDYEEYIGFRNNFPDYSDTYFGAVDNKWTAAKVGAGFFKELHGKSERPITVRYDSENDMWLVTGYFWPGIFHNKKGGSANIIINASDGRLVALWHGK